ncbi:MAG TPA: addiction module protein [Thermoanaerobaculia bacterium]|nr:addiction module protein [Thermoanaerobaculia bacterium]
MTTKALAQRALALPLADRIDLAQQLWQSIEDRPREPEDELSRQLARLAADRDRELASGLRPGTSHEQVMERARRALR